MRAAQYRWPLLRAAMRPRIQRPRYHPTNRQGVRSLVVAVIAPPMAKSHCRRRSVSLEGDTWANWAILQLCRSMPARPETDSAETVDSYLRQTKPSRMRLGKAVVATPWVQNRSFMPIGNGPAILRAFAFGLDLVGASAAARACSGVCDEKMCV